MGGEKLNSNRIIYKTALFAVCFIFLLFPVYAQNQEQPLSGFNSPEEAIVLGESATQEPIGSGASGWIIIRMVLVLALAALAIYGMVFFVKRLARPPQSRDPHLKILASVPLGGDNFAAVISVGKKAYLIGGGSSGGISLISEVEDQEVLESMLLDEAQKSADQIANKFPDFRSFLHRLGVGNRKPQESDFNFHGISLGKQRERLKGLGS